MSTTFLIFVYNDPEALPRLVAKLRGNGNQFLVHVDKRVALEEFQRVLVGQDIHFMEDSKRRLVAWGGYSFSLALSEMLTHAVANLHTDWYQFLSGACYPLCEASQIEQKYQQGCERLAYWEGLLVDDPAPFWTRKRIFGYAFNDQPWYNKREIARLGFPLKPFVWGFSVAVKLCLLALPARRPPGNIRIYRGTSWTAITNEEARKIVRFLSSPQWPALARFFKYSAASDEMIFHTIISQVGLGHLQKPSPRRGYIHGTHWIDWRNGRSVPDMDEAMAKLALASKALFCRKLPPSTTAQGVAVRNLLDAGQAS